MGLSRGSLYLREPTTQTYLAADGSRGAVLEVVPDRLPPTYKSSAGAAFAGLPLFPQPIVRFPEQWSLIHRTRRRVIVKEVNPLAITWIADSYTPRMVLLLRHPAAVANSFFKSGWTNSQFERIFSADTLAAMDVDYRAFKHSFWAEHGALQAVVLKMSLDALSRLPDHRIVKYEDLCADPVSIYRELYDFASLNWSKAVEAQIRARSADREEHKTGDAGVYRDSREMIHKWKSEMSSEAINDIRGSYLSFDPPYYGVDEW